MNELKVSDLIEPTFMAILHEAATPLIAALEAQIASCERGDKCEPCNQARKALQEFHEKYPKLQDVK